MSEGTPPPGERRLLAIDTATRTAVVALGDGAGAPIALDAWRAGHRHGEQLLGAVVRLLARADLPLVALDGIVVGTGPGAFTGLRVGLAAAKGLAYGLGCPITGVESARALARAATMGTGRQGDAASAARRVALVLPAGPADRTVTEVRLEGGEVRLEGAPRLVAGGIDPFAGTAGALLVAVDLDDAPEPARSAGERAVDGLGAALLALGAARLAAGERDDLAALAPVYVTLPRGVSAATGEVAWSPDLR